MATPTETPISGAQSITDIMRTFKVGNLTERSSPIPWPRPGELTLGHSQIGITANLCGHIHDERRRVIATRMDAFLGRVAAPVAPNGSETSIGNEPIPDTVYHYSAEDEDKLAPPEGFEPPTVGLEVRCSVH